jgi:hypothetical protein
MRKLILFLLFIPLLTNGQILDINRGNDTGMTHIHGFLKVEKAFHGYGGFQASDFSQALTEDVWAHCTNATNTLWTNSEGDGMSLSKDTMTMNILGDYHGIVTITFSGTAGNEFQLRLYNVTTASQVAFFQGQTGDGAGNLRQLNLPLYIENDTENSKYVLQVQNISANNAIVYRHGVYEITYIHNGITH